MTTAAETIAATVAAGKAPVPFGGEGGYPRYSENETKVAYIAPGKKGYGAGQTECCAYCGKLCLNPRFFAFLTCGGAFEVYEDGHDGILGFYPLGSDCARRLKKAVPVYARCEADKSEVGAEWGAAKRI